MEVSKLLAMKDGSIRKWLTDTAETHALIAGIYGVLQPNAHEKMLQGFRLLAETPALVSNTERLQTALDAWSFPMHAISIISNRTTPLHRDTKGFKEVHDLLVALGNYTHGRFSLPGLGLRLRYDPGCILSFSGRLFRHGASCPAPRACIIYYGREAVLKRLRISTPDWTTIGEDDVTRA